MRGRARSLLLAAALAAGCATAPSAPDPLGRADQEMAATRYRDAVRLYEEFIRANPEHPAAVRARGAQAALDALITAQADMARLRTELAQRDAELARVRQELAGRAGEVTARNAEVARLRRELDGRAAEVERLKTDLERLRSIDLRREPGRR